MKDETDKKTVGKDLEEALSDVLIGRPHEFKVEWKQKGMRKQKRFCLYPVTLAKTMLLRRHVETLNLDNDILSKNPFLEALRVVKERKRTVCTILAYETAPNSKKDLFDMKEITFRRDFFDKHLSDDDMATLLILALDDKTDKLMKHLGLDKEHERMMKVMAVKQKHDHNSITFGGLSIFGTFIGQLKEMGYSDDEILYEKGYSYLRLMLADKMTQVILTDEESREIPTGLGGGFVDANDPENAKKIMAALKTRGVSSKQTN